jgi:hypothetical protein
MIRDVDFLPISDPGSRGQKGTRSRIRIRKTGRKPDSRISKILVILPMSFELVFLISNEALYERAR